MAVLKSLFDFYLKSSIHVALSVCAFQYAAFLFMELKPDEFVMLFTFLAAISGYNFVKYAERARWYHKSLPVELRRIQLFSLVCFIALVGVALLLPFNTLAGFALLALLTLGYVVPMLPQAKSLRSLAGLKIFIVALVWAAASVGIPLWHYGSLPGADQYILFIQIFLTVFALTIPFEIRDLDLDQPDLKTLPQTFGIKNSRNLGLAAIFVAAIMEGFKDGFYYVSNLYWLAMAVLIVIGLFRSSSKQSPYLAAFWIEAIPILVLLILFLIVDLPLLLS